MRRNVVIALCLAGFLLASAVRSDAQSPAAKSSPAPAKCKSVKEYLNSTGYILGGQLSKLVAANFNGTVFLPTDKAFTAVQDLILDEASKIANKTVTLPPSLDLFTLAELMDVLKLHIVPDAAIDPTALKPAAFGTKTVITLDLDTTLLSAVKPQSLCPNATTAALSAIVKASDTSPVVVLEKVTIVAAGSNATVINATVGDLCDGVVHIINTVLLPCAPAQSTIPALAKSLAGPSTPGLPMASPKPGVATSPSPSPSPKPSSASASGMSIGTMVAALCAVMIMSGSTFYTMVGGVIMVAGGLMTIANI